MSVSGVCQTHLCPTPPATEVVSRGLAAQKERALCAENDVKGYPTLKYWHTDPAAGDAPGGGASKYTVRPNRHTQTLRET